LSQLFASLLNMQGEEKAQALRVLQAALDNQQGEPWQTIRLIANSIPTTAAFSPCC
jgi:mannose-6-phosphate isomerase